MRKLVVNSDGQSLLWEGFHVGPRTLSVDDLKDISRALLGLELNKLDSAVCHELQLYTGAHQAESFLLLNSASPLKRSFETDLAAVAEGRTGDDFSTYNEVRAVCLAGPNDLVVGRTAPWQEAVNVTGVESVRLPDAVDYYLSHALLKLAIRHRERSVPALERILDRLRRQPGTVVRIFALEIEFRIFLLWLKREAGLDRLVVDANGPEIADHWNHKSSLHPTVEAAASLAVELDGDPLAILEAESARNRFATELGLMIPRLPGYTITRAGATHDELVTRIRTAAALLGQRYGLATGCFKPATSALIGSRIRLSVPLSDTEGLDALAVHMLETDEDYIFEAQADYLRHRVEGHEFTMTPSVHLQAGVLQEGATLQITRGSVWQGNVYIDEQNCDRLGLSIEHYRYIRDKLAEFLDAFQGAGRDRGLVKGGIDFAICRLGGRFERNVLVGMQDPNLSSNGAEYVRAFRAQARRARPEMQRVYAATKSVRPAPDVGLRRLKQAVDHQTESLYARAMVSCPGRWGLIGVASRDSVGATEAALALEAKLAEQGLITIIGGLSEDGPKRSSDAANTH